MGEPFPLCLWVPVLSCNLVAGRKVMSVNGNLMLSNFTGISSSVSLLGLRFGQLNSSLLQNQFITYLAVELKEKNLALVATRAFPRNCFQTPRQKLASPNVDVAWYYFIAQASQAT